MISRRRFSLGLTAAPLLLAACGQNSSGLKEFRIGVLGGENEADRLARYDGFRALIEEKLALPTKIFQASDYSGVMQAWSAKQIEMAMLSPSAYAGIWLDTGGNIEPLVVTKEIDGSLGYVAVIYVRADSPYRTIEDLAGKAFAYADPNSASGYLVPRSELREAGMDPETFFGRTGFAGGHEQGIVAVLQGQYDAGVTWASGVGDVTQGYSRGTLRAMVEKNMLDMGELRIIWTSRLIPNGPASIRKDLPPELKQKVRDILLALPAEHPDIYRQTQRGEGAGFAELGHDFFEPLIAMRREEADQRRAR
jgi:phosphonate transport system substrate-binding protein